MACVDILINFTISTFLVVYQPLLCLETNKTTLVMLIMFHARFLGLSAFAFGIASCQPTEQRLPTFPVTGSLVFADKRPVTNASVVFHPLDPAIPLRPRGKVAADGSFQLTSYDGNDGAPTGKYRVTVELWLAGRPDEGPSNRLPEKFAKPESSGLEATVGTGPTTIEPLVLKR